MLLYFTNPNSLSVKELVMVTSMGILLPTIINQAINKYVFKTYCSPADGYVKSL